MGFVVLSKDVQSRFRQRQQTILVARASVDVNFADRDHDGDFELASRSDELQSGPISRASEGEELAERR